MHVVSFKSKLNALVFTTMTCMARFLLEQDDDYNNYCFYTHLVCLI